MKLLKSLKPVALVGAGIVGAEVVGRQVSTRFLAEQSARNAELITGGGLFVLGHLSRKVLGQAAVGVQANGVLHCLAAFWAGGDFDLSRY